LREAGRRERKAEDDAIADRLHGVGQEPETIRFSHSGQIRHFTLRRATDRQQYRTRRRRHQAPSASAHFEAEYAAPPARGFLPAWDEMLMMCPAPAAIIRGTMARIRLSYSIAEELCSHNLRVNVVCPGSVDTEFSPYTGKQPSRSVVPKTLHTLWPCWLLSPRSHS